MEGEMETRTRRQLATGAAALMLIALGASLLVACGGSSDGGGTPQTIEITPVAESGTTVEAKVGDTVVVSLEANETTGYEWSFTAGDTFTVVSSEYVPDENAGDLMGAGGTQVVTLEVTKAGSSDLTGTYRQSWATPSPDAQPDFSMTVSSTE